MKKLFPLLATAVACLTTTASAYAQPVGTFVCNGIPQFNVSSYSLGVLQGIFPTHGGQIVPPALTQLSLSASIVQYKTFFALALQGKTEQTCTLMVTGNDDAFVKITLRDVQVASVQLTAAGPAKKDEEKSAFTSIALNYTNVSVETSGSGNDGGTCSWSQTCNTPPPIVITPTPPQS